MYTIGLTGGIGSGKTRVADLLQGWGAAVIDTDQIAHELTAPGGEAIAPLREAFGDEVITPEGAMDRAVMRERVFTDPVLRRRLESIIHPMIGAVTERRAICADGAYLVLVIPLLVESGRWRDRLDRLCVVDCDEATQRLRVQERSGLTQPMIERIMSAQASREARLAAADDVLFNGAGVSVDDLEGLTRALHDQWCQRAANKQAAGLERPPPSHGT